MKYLFHILAAWMLSPLWLSAPVGMATDGPPPEAAPVHRFWSPVHGRHFYTIDDTEKETLLARYPDVWTYEGTAFRALPSRSDDCLAPVHRFWSALLNAHFYTIDDDEADWLIVNYPHTWTYEGIAFYAYPAGSRPADTVPVHRFWSGPLGTHFYTTSDRERFSLIGQYPETWQYEGVAYYAYPREDSSAVEIVKGPALRWATPDSVTILWETDVPADTSVGYGMGSGDRHMVSDPALVTLHKAVLSGLDPDALYSYTAVSGPASKVGAFTSMPQAGQPFRFAVYGDSRTYPDAHARVAESIRMSRPRIVFHTGDLVGAGRDLTNWETEFFEPAAGLIANAPLIPVPGNHEYAGSGPLWFFYFFDRPGHEGWFALTYGDARFIGLDTSAPYAAGTPQHNWLVQELSSAAYRDAAWRIVILHEPPFTSTVGRADNPAVRGELVPLFEQSGVDVVFCGHSHTYERYLHNGIYYIVTGGGGGPLYPLAPDTTPPIRQFGLSVHHHCIADVAAGTLTISAVDIAGEIFDSVELRK